MKKFRFPSCSLSCGLAGMSLLAMLSLPLQASEAAPAKYHFNLPPSAELDYAIRARQGGISLDGNAVVQWTTAEKKFTVTNEARASLLGRILDSKSEGRIDAHGLAPVSFTEKRFRKDATTTTFDRASGTIRFSTSEQTYPIQGGEQDRNTAVWQLVAVARATAAKFKPGSEWTFFVAGQRDAEPWTFKVVSQEKIRTPLGEVNALHILKEPPPDSKEQQVDLWLAPQQEWYPVRIRYSDADGDFIEQTLERVTHKSS
jgi:hypothetical protein